MPDVDVLVLGGGVTGLATACLLAKAGAEVAVVEARPPRPPAETDIRVSAISPASEAVLEACGAWADLAADRRGIYTAMCVWSEDSDPQHGLNFRADEAGVSHLGYIAENNALRYALWAELERLPRVRLLAGASARSVSVTADGAELGLDDDSVVTARLIVGADGINSWLREQMSIDVRDRGYAQIALVAHLESDEPHQHTAWQNFLPTGPLALLPLADGRCSLVWSCEQALAEELLELPAASFEERVSEASGRVLGNLRLTTERFGFPLDRRHASAYCGDRFVLVGDAAHRVHPLAGQGLNLGLADAGVLAAELGAHMAAGGDPGDRRVLRRYERRRKGENLTTLGLMDGLHELFAGNLSSLSPLASQGMTLLNRTPLIKRWLAEQAMGRQDSAVGNTVR